MSVLSVLEHGPTDWRQLYATEAELATAVHWYLRQRTDHHITRVEASEAHGRRRGTAKGSPDWSGCVLGGRHIEIELKSAKGKSKPEQIARGERIRKLGGIYEVCRSVAEVHAAIEKAMGER
jgi:hypothetical protein